MTDKETVSICAQEIQNLHHAKTLTANLYNLRESGSLCDITLLSNGSAIKAHRVVLAACSEYFHVMFTNGLSETTLNEIPMKNIDSKALEVLVNYAYTGVLFIDEINVQILLETADLLQFQSAKSLCCDFIKEQLSTENCLDIFQFADVYHCNDVLSLSQGVFNKNWKKIVDSESFLLLDYYVFVKLISDDSLNVNNESEVMVMITKWIEADEENRRDKLPSLLHYVRWPYINPKQLDKITFNPLIQSDEKLLADLERWCVPVIPDCPAMRQSYTEWMYVLGGEQSFLMGMKSCEFFDYSTSSWAYGFSLNRPRTSFAAVGHSDKLFVIGGMCLGEKLRNVECYSEKEGRWRRLASLKKCQGDVKAAVIDDVVYVAGGSSGGEPACKYVEKYDESNNHWIAVATMKSRRRRFGLCAYKSKLYAFGGFQDSLGELKACEMYDPEENAWESIASMKTNRCEFGVAVLSGCMYVAGGVNSYTGSMNTVEKYDPVTDEWCTCKPLLQARGGHAMVSYFGRLIAIGGMNGYMQTCKDAECYDEVKDEWSSLSVTNVPRFGSVAVVLPFCKRGKEEEREKVIDNDT